MPDLFGRWLFFAGGGKMIAVERPPGVSPEIARQMEPEIQRQSADTVSVKFADLAERGHLMRWRAADSEWSKWTRQGTTLNLFALKPGEYTVQYELMNKWLEVSPSAEIKFTIKYDVEQIVREAVEKLFSKNWEERNAAVKTLARFPEQARAALQKIAADRQRLGDSDRWWLDAALEQVGGH